jgi:hypothetical protein
MAFTSDVTRRGTFGSYKVRWGSYTSDGASTGGNIDTQLNNCYFISLTPNKATAVTTASVVNETLPAAGSAITIVTEANQVGYWFAIGK